MAAKQFSPRDKPQTLEQSYTLDHVRQKFEKRDLLLEKSQNVHNIGKSNNFRQAQKVLSGEVQGKILN